MDDDVREMAEEFGRRLAAPLRPIDPRGVPLTLALLEYKALFTEGVIRSLRFTATFDGWQIEWTEAPKPRHQGDLSGSWREVTITEVGEEALFRLGLRARLQLNELRERFGIAR